MTKQVLGWSLVLVGAVAGCTTTLSGGSEAGGGIQDPEGSAIVAPGEGGGGASASTTAGTGGAGGGVPGPPWGQLPGPPDLPTHRPAACAQGERIVVLTQEDDLLAFDPATEAFVAQNPLACEGGDSMAMTDAGGLFSFSGSQVLMLDPATGACSVLAGFATTPEFDMFALGFVGGVAAPGGRGPSGRWARPPSPPGPAPSPCSPARLRRA